jgi:hypothetical protein
MVEGSGMRSCSSFTFTEEHVRGGLGRALAGVMSRLTAEECVLAGLGMHNRWTYNMTHHSQTCGCRFGHAQLLDDIVDHWDAGSHKQERRNLMKRLQHYSSEAEVRVSFVSGDVHCCGAGRVYSRPKVRRNTTLTIRSKA